MPRKGKRKAANDVEKRGFGDFVAVRDRVGKLRKREK
jgi:hypothetical protein